MKEGSRSFASSSFLEVALGLLIVFGIFVFGFWSDGAWPFVGTEREIVYGMIGATVIIFYLFDLHYTIDGKYLRISYRFGVRPPYVITYRHPIGGWFTFTPSTIPLTTIVEIKPAVVIISENYPGWLESPVAHLRFQNGKQCCLHFNDPMQRDAFVEALRARLQMSASQPTKRSMSTHQTSALVELPSWVVGAEQIGARMQKSLFYPSVIGIILIVAISRFAVGGWIPIGILFFIALLWWAPFLVFAPFYALALAWIGLSRSRLRLVGGAVILLAVYVFFIWGIWKFWSFDGLAQLQSFNPGRWLDGPALTFGR